MCAGQRHSGPGGRGGSGVGTWADDSGLYPNWASGENTENRPAMDGRGLTDRGTPQLADNLNPTKVHGQVSPGGQMPSITLKGLSIKGSSKVSYEEAASAAQNEAQSALNHDQVPRAYQGAVKDYFDDLKK
jgi:flavin-binding protein dodecin